MTISKPQSRPAVLSVTLASIALAALLLTACGKASDQASVPPAAETGGPALATVSAAPAGDKAAGATPVAAGGLVVAAPTDVKAPPTETVVPPNSNAAAEATADNAKVADLAKQFEADPAAITRQSAACGPADQVLDGLYALSHGVMTDELRRFRVACMAKDQAQREVSRKAASTGGGVKNTNSL